MSSITLWPRVYRHSHVPSSCCGPKCWQSVNNMSNKYPESPWCLITTWHHALYCRIITVNMSFFANKGARILLCCFVFRPYLRRKTILLLPSAIGRMCNLSFISVQFNISQRNLLSESVSVQVHRNTCPALIVEDKVPWIMFVSWEFSTLSF
jgi:hypothetical protein